MTSYNAIKEMIISTLVGRPAGTEIQPENQQEYDLSMLDYIHSLELLSNSPLIGVAQENTTPVQPNDSRVSYIAGIAQDRQMTFNNFIGEDGQPLSILTTEMEAYLVILIWNTEYWQLISIPTNIISSAETAYFYYNYNIRKTYKSVALMNEDVNPVGLDGRPIRIGDIVSVVNPTTPAENGFYSRIANGWLFQTGFNFELSNSLGNDGNVGINQAKITETVGNLGRYLSGIPFNNDGRVDYQGALQPTGVGLKRTGYVSLFGISAITVLGFASDIPNGGTACVAFYDSNKVFISSVYGDSNNFVLQKITVPVNSAFCVSCGFPGSSFLILRSFEDLKNEIEKIGYINVNQLFPKADPQTEFYTLATARSIIPIFLRKSGQVITFHSSYRKYEIWRYNGMYNQSDTPTGWNNDELWDRIADDKDIANLQEQIDFSKGYKDLSNATLVDGYIINYTNGVYEIMGTSSGATASYLECAGASLIELSMQTGPAGGINGLAFYDKDRNYITGYPKQSSTLPPTRVMMKFAVPAGAVYFRTTYWNTVNRVTQGEFSCKVYYKNQAQYDEVILGEREICDFYGIYAKDGSPYYSLGDLYEGTILGLTSFIDCKGVEFLEITMPVLDTDPVQGLVFYDASKNPLSGVLRYKGSSFGSKIAEISVPVGAVYFRTTYWNYENSKLYGSFYCKLKYPIGFLGMNQKRIYQTGEIYFSPIVNQTVNNYWDDTNFNLTPEVYKATTGVLLLPPNYNPNGKPCPIIMYCHGYSHFVYYDHWGANETFRLQKQKWASLGFAVFDCNGARNDNKQPNFTGAGSIQFATAFKKTFEYIKQYYNVEDKICVVGGSAGGPTAINFCFNYSNLVSKLALLSPWTDIALCSWGQSVRTPFVEYLGFANTTTYEKDKTIGYDPALRISTIAGVEQIPQFPVAVKTWVGSLEVGSTLYQPILRFMAAARASGNLAFLRTIEGVGHEIVSGNLDVPDLEVAEWFNT